ncbi:MAG: DUF3124 domain-containing protein [Desulfatibacillaceae bacterium]
MAFFNGLLCKPTVLGPLAATRFVIAESDRAGGSGASFLVRWVSDEPVCAPLMESVAAGTRNQQGISFVSRGQVVEDAAP